MIYNNIPEFIDDIIVFAVLSNYLFPHNPYHRYLKNTFKIIIYFDCDKLGALCFESVTLTANALGVHIRTADD